MWWICKMVWETVPGALPLNPRRSQNHFQKSFKWHFTKSECQCLEHFIPIPTRVQYILMLTTINITHTRDLRLYKSEGCGDQNHSLVRARYIRTCTEMPQAWASFRTKLRWSCTVTIRGTVPVREVVPYKATTLGRSI